MINKNNYVVIPGWAVTDLKLKGNNLLVYSIIYGFCQDKESCYRGSIEYLQEWTNSTRQAVSNSLKYLVSQKLITKENSFPTNIYRICKENLHQDDFNCKINLQDNINNNINNNIINNNSALFNKKDTYLENSEYSSRILEIINYMNKVCGTHFKSNSAGTKKLLTRRLKEGYIIDDFINVINYKYAEWGANPVKFSNGQLSNIYLRPSTLFGNKFEEYLQAANITAKELKNKVEVKSEIRSDDRSDITF